MSKTEVARDASLPIESLEQIDEVCVAFEDLWKSSQPVEIESLLTEVNFDNREHLLYELLLIEFAYIRDQGQSVPYGDYRTKFAVYSSAVEHAIEDFLPRIDTTRLTTIGTPPSRLIGQRVRYVGNYEILEEIARGGMGVVYKARQQKLNRIVALKMILSGHFASDREIERFLREARAAGALNHPNIVAIHEVGEFEGRHYFTMDFVDGQSLAQLIQKETLHPKDAASLVSKIAETVHFAHEKGTIHRDLKPSNILLNRQGVPLVTDFGLAKLYDVGSAENSLKELTPTNQILGTPSYMSPEQAAGRSDQYGSATDVWSLGAILYASLTGRAPFVADNAVDTMLQVMRHEPLPLRSLNPSVPKDLETICFKCLSKRIEQRYFSAKQLAEDLQRFLENRPIHARRVGTMKKSLLWVQRNPRTSGLLALISLSLLTGSLVSSYFAIEANVRADSEAEARKAAIAHEARAGVALARVEEALAKNRQLLESERAARREAEVATHRALREKTAAIKAMHLEEIQTQKLKREQRSNQWQRYVAQLQMMQVAWIEKDSEYLKSLLMSSIPTKGQADFRGWEWYFFWDEIEHRPQNIGEGNRISAHEGAVRGLDWSPNGNQIITSGDDKLLKLWDSTTLQLVRQFQQADFNLVHDLEWDEKSQSLISVDAEGLSFWNLEEGIESVRISTSAGDCPTLSLNPKSDHVAVGSDRVRVFAPPQQASVATSAPVGKWFSPHYSPDGTMILAVSAQRITLIDEKTGKLVFDSGKGSSSDGRRDAAWSPDGRLFAVGGDQILIFDAHTFQVVAELNDQRSPSISLSFSPSGTRLLSTGSDNRLAIWDCATGDLLIHLVHPNESGLTAAKWSPSGKQIAVSTRSGHYWVWGSRELSQLALHPEFIEDAVLSKVQSIEIALKDATSRIQLNPEDQEARESQVELLMRIRRWKAALQSLNEYIKRYPHNPWSSTRGLILAVVVNDSKSIREHSELCRKFLNSSDDNWTKAQMALALAVCNSPEDDPNELVKAARPHSENGDRWDFQYPLMVALLRDGKLEELSERIRVHEKKNDFSQLQVLSLLDALRLYELGELDLAAQSFVVARAYSDVLPEIYRSTPINELISIPLHREVKQKLGVDMTISNDSNRHETLLESKD
ncbi:serine/threonine-protein kinase [Thalassoglobus sp. JC818]|uniref:serine/threonine-protein kinase n=1 Tax=Thalassoglobus sp. JC818 TaxID=3232136 RepID=UPI00345973BA